MAAVQPITEIVLKVRLSEAARAKLAAQAKQEGCPLDEYASQQLEHAAVTKPVDSGAVSAASDAAQFDQILDDFFAADPETLPTLPDDFSRRDIYADHD